MSVVIFGPVDGAEYCQEGCPFCAAGVPFARGVTKRPDRSRMYRCDGCGRLTNDPQEDIDILRNRLGCISCCPERKMKPVAPVPTTETTQ